MSSLMPRMRSTGSNIDGQVQVAIATWIGFCWAETAIILSPPRHATARTYLLPLPLRSRICAFAASSSSTEKGI